MTSSGDKTFFIAAIMAMRHNRLVIFTGAISALCLMSVLSAYVGTVFTYIPKYYTHYAVTALFFFFGIKLLREGFSMADDEGAEELEEVRWLCAQCLLGFSGEVGEMLTRKKKLFYRPVMGGSILITAAGSFPLPFQPQSKTKTKQTQKHCSWQS